VHCCLKFKVELYDPTQVFHSKKALCDNTREHCCPLWCFIAGLCGCMHDIHCRNVRNDWSALPPQLIEVWSGLQHVSDILIFIQCVWNLHYTGLLLWAFTESVNSRLTGIPTATFAMRVMLWCSWAWHECAPSDCLLLGLQAHYCEDTCASFWITKYRCRYCM